MSESGPATFPKQQTNSLLAVLGRLAATLAMVGLSTAVGVQMAIWGTSAVDLLYLPAVLAAATIFGLPQGFFAALASALAYNFFFTVPVHTFRISRPSDLVTVAILFLVALVTSHLAAEMRRQSRAANLHAARNATIARLARSLLSCSTRDEIGSVACHELAALFASNAVLVCGTPEPIVISAEPETVLLSPLDLAASDRVLKSGEPSASQASEWVFHPVRSRLTVVAALGLARDNGSASVGEERLALLSSLLDQVALALERERLESEMRLVTELRERDRLRDALLSSVGHDLRTPLTTIIAAASELRRSGQEPALVETVVGEAAKLERYITNLLDMARLDAGAVRLKNEAVDLVDAVSAALRDLHKALAGHPIEVSFPESLPLVTTDPYLLHHCLINLLDNAARHSGSTAGIYVIAKEEAGDVLLAVEDEGGGMLNDSFAPFDTFSHFRGSDQAGGAGLGLAIVKGFSAAMGIDATARRRDPIGAAFVLRFPAHMTLSAREPDAE